MNTKKQQRKVAAGTPADYTDIKKRVSLVIPPVPTTFNGKQIPMRKPLHEFKVTLPTEIADDTGVSKMRQRSTQGSRKGRFE